ncbi:LOW QUALITY PROTEIN: hypothetical protein ACHAW6_014678 [Cyclotella cf. meneghiniana]
MSGSSISSLAWKNTTETSGKMLQSACPTHHSKSAVTPNNQNKQKLNKPWYWTEMHQKSL